MRTIERTNAFRSDFKREKRGQHRRDLEAMVSSIVSLLAADKPLNKSIATTRLASGVTTENAISNPICC